MWDWPAGDPEAAGRSLPDEQLAEAEEWIHRHAAAAQAITTGRLRALARLLAEAVTGRLASAHLADQIRQLLGDRAWAAMTALTEVVRAASAGTTATYRHSGIVAVRWETEPDNLTCPRCRDLEQEGPVPIGSAWADGTTAPPAHPRCRCYLSPA
ncbi:phage head morphogenesis protein [Kitasatospora sp. NBC_00240]|uniref:phage minor head protein n=1 Tax=Kitasatospora sp. NBC_00240 TaxID=2903567 RepID=UPI002253A883|nr:phage minor head protein [Kitasatospora sp. NBC_00240]MCX5209809.1 phage head morphogenesis protein [Kitasatospora sp. NBC_00240]